MTPQRLRLSRKAGFNLQDASQKLNGLPAINCARPSRFGNPFRVGKTEGGLIRDAAEAVRLFKEWLDGLWPQVEPRRRDQILLHLWMLRDHNGACHCQPDQPCHVNVLLKRAAALRIIGSQNPR